MNPTPFYTVMWLALCLVVYGLSGCATPRPVPVVLLPEQIVQPCDPLAELREGDARTVLQWAIQAHADHGQCMLRKRLLDQIVIGAAGQEARLQVLPEEGSL